MEQIRGFMNQDAFEAFLEFNRMLQEDFNLGYVRPRYTKTWGWVYDYGRSGYILVKDVLFHESYITVLDHKIYHKNEVASIMYRIDQMFHDGFLVRLAAFDDARTERRQQKRLEKGDLTDEAVYKRNCRWPSKVSRSDLKRLYYNDSMMLLEEDLLDEVGLTISVRCQIAKRIYDLMEKGKIECTICGEILSGKSLITCACGLEYTYHSYRKAFRENNMPRGAASDKFDQFVADWEQVKTPQEKMRLIDNMIHEFHIAVISGNKGRPVGVNLIQGSKKQIVELIEELAVRR